MMFLLSCTLIAVVPNVLPTTNARFMPHYHSRDVLHSAYEIDEEMTTCSIKRVLPKRIYSLIFLRTVNTGRTWIEEGKTSLWLPWLRPAKR